MWTTVKLREILNFMISIDRCLIFEDRSMWPMKSALLPKSILTPNSVSPGSRALFSSAGWREETILKGQSATRWKAVTKTDSYLLKILELLGWVTPESTCLVGYLEIETLLKMTLQLWVILTISIFSISDLIEISCNSKRRWLEALYQVDPIKVHSCLLNLSSRNPQSNKILM